MDAFISYRRKTGGLFAYEIYEFLTNECKMDVFYDERSFREHVGDFPEILQKNIKSAENFILIMTDLNDIDYEKSVFIKEIKLALEENKRIIVVTANGFTFPENIDSSIEKIPRLQSIEILTPKYFKNEFRIDLLAKFCPSEKRNKAYEKLTTFTKLESRLQIENRLPLSNRLCGDVVSVDMCAFACKGLLSDAREHVERLLKAKCQFRIVMSHPDSLVAKDAYEKKISGGSTALRRNIINDSYRTMLNWQDDYPNDFEGRTTNEFLTCAIFIIHTKDPQKDTIKVDYYSFECTNIDRRSVIITAKDEDNFKFYIDQFEWLWNHAAPTKATDNNLDSKK